jgi:hypothetical protein
VKNIGIALKKGWIVRIEGKLYEVARDNEWNTDFGCWGSVELVNEYPPRFTHKGGIEIVCTSFDNKPMKFLLTTTLGDERVVETSCWSELIGDLRVLELGSLKKIERIA